MPPLYEFGEEFFFVGNIFPFYHADFKEICNPNALIVQNSKLPSKTQPDLHTVCFDFQNQQQSSLEDGLSIAQAANSTLPTKLIHSTRITNSTNTQRESKQKLTLPQENR